MLAFCCEGESLLPAVFKCVLPTCANPPPRSKSLMTPGRWRLHFRFPAPAGNGLFKNPWDLAQVLLQNIRGISWGVPYRSVREFLDPFEASGGDECCPGLCLSALWFSSSLVSKVRLCVQVHLAQTLHFHLLCHSSVEAFSVLRFLFEGVGNFHLADGVSPPVRCK